jgi:hypothetical protein
MTVTLAVTGMVPLTVDPFGGAVIVTMRLPSCAQAVEGFRPPRITHKAMR